MSASERLSEQLRDLRATQYPKPTTMTTKLGLAGTLALAHSRPLSLSSKAQQLERQAWDLAPNLFQGLAAQDRVVLMEIACEPDSALTAAVQSLMGSEEAAVRAALWNSCDLGTSAGVKLNLDRIQVERPQQVWISPPCGPFRGSMKETP